MTNQQGAPEALFYADALDRCAEVDFDHIFVPSAAVIRRLHAENQRLAALVEAQQPAPSAAADLHPKTADLVQRFAAALADKLAAAEKKYGYSDGWASPDWMDECRLCLREHLFKGDPRDVAAYCAFLWHHGEGTALPSEVVEDRVKEFEQLFPARKSSTPQADSQPAPLIDAEAVAYNEWFKGEQGSAYDGMWSFARAAWMTRAARAPADSVTEPAPVGRECCNENCGWVGSEADCVHPKHDPSQRLCPKCYEVTERVGAPPAQADSQPAPDEFQPCPSCFGTGVEGDADDYGHTIDVTCGDCNGSGRAASAPADSVTAPAGVAGLMVDRATVIEWLDANEIEVTDRQMEGLFHFAVPTPPAQAADSALEDADPIRALIAEHAAILDQNESAYFELCYHRATGWMAWITDKPLCMPPVVNPDRKVLAQGQGDTADEACRDAARN